MKKFDVHIGVSDSVMVTKKNPVLEGTIEGELPNQFDLIRVKQGELDTFCGMMCPVIFEDGDFVFPKNLKKEILQHIQVYKNLENSNYLQIIRNKSDFDKQGLKVILGLEGVYFVDDNKVDLIFLQKIIDMGVKVIGPMWNFKNRLFNKKKVGIIAAEFLSICERNNIIIDLAHSEEDEFSLILQNYKGKVIDSHTNLFSLNPNRRNIKDAQIEAIIKKNGIVGLTFVGDFVNGNSIEKVFEHISTFVEKFGDTNLVIGSDFDGMDKMDLVEGLSDVSEYDNLSEFMTKKGFSKNSIDNIFFKNAYNFFKTSFDNR